MIKYEYLTKKRLDLQGNRLNDLGRQGWKLIDVIKETDEPSWANELLFMRKIKEPK